MRRILRGILATAIAILLSAYSANNIARNTHPETRAVGSEALSLQASQDEFEDLARSVGVKSQIMDQYADWKGVHYRLDGGIKKGIDCSGFVRRAPREQFGLEFPCLTYEQQEMGKPVSHSNLRTDDLALFRVGSMGRHVGVYINNNQFVYVSTNNGVTTSSMNEPYWKKRYNETHRVLSRS